MGFIRGSAAVNQKVEAETYFQKHCNLKVLTNLGKLRLCVY